MPRRESEREGGGGEATTGAESIDIAARKEHSVSTGKLGREQESKGARGERLTSKLTPSKA